MDILEELEEISDIFDLFNDTITPARYDVLGLDFNGISPPSIPPLFSYGNDKQVKTYESAIQTLINLNDSAYTIQTTERNASGGSQGIIKTINSKTPDSDIMDISTNLNK